MGERQSTTWEGKRELGTISGARWSTEQVVALGYVYGRGGIREAWDSGEKGEGGNTRRKRMTMMGPRPSMGRWTKGSKLESEGEGGARV